MWQITDLPADTGGHRDYIGWLKRGDTHVKISISPQGLTHEQAMVIMQHFAGIISDAGLASALQSPDDHQ